MSRDPELSRVGPVHPGRGAPSHIEAMITYRGLRDQPIETIRLTVPEALRLLAELAQAVEIVTRRNAEKETA